MTIVNIRKVVLQDHDTILLASGEKIMVTRYDHPPPEDCNFFTALMRKEVDCTLATTKWMDEIERKGRYSFSDDSDLEKKEENSSQGDNSCHQQGDYGNDDGDLTLDDYDPDPEEYHNIINMMDK